MIHLKLKRAELLLKRDEIMQAMENPLLTSVERGDNITQSNIITAKVMRLNQQIAGLL